MNHKYMVGYIFSNPTLVDAASPEDAAYHYHRCRHGMSISAAIHVHTKNNQWVLSWDANTQSFNNLET